MEIMTAPLLETLTEDPDTLRAFRRFALNFTVGISLSSDKPPIRGTTPLSSNPATLTNASMSGLCFSSLTEYPEGTLIQIELELGSQTHLIPAIVRRCSSAKRLGRTFHECGVQFLKSEATLRFLPLMAKHLLIRGAGKSRQELMA
jgi:hypothetical protein